MHKTDNNNPNLISYKTAACSQEASTSAQFCLSIDFLKYIHLCLGAVLGISFFLTHFSLFLSHIVWSFVLFSSAVAVYKLF